MVIGELILIVKCKRKRKMRELNLQEVEQVNGGILPLAAAAYSLATGTAVRSVGGYVLNRAASVYAVYSAAEYYGSR